jgi:hypothetical protein
MPKLRMRGIAFDMHRIVMDLGTLAGPCKEIVHDTIAFTA